MRVRGILLAGPHPDVVHGRCPGAVTRPDNHPRVGGDEWQHQRGLVLVEHLDREAGCAAGLAGSRAVRPAFRIGWLAVDGWVAWAWSAEDLKAAGASDEAICSTGPDVHHRSGSQLCGLRRAIADHG